MFSLCRDLFRISRHEAYDATSLHQCVAVRERKHLDPESLDVFITSRWEEHPRHLATFQADMRKRRIVTLRPALFDHRRYNIAITMTTVTIGTQVEEWRNSLPTVLIHKLMHSTYGRKGKNELLNRPIAYADHDAAKDVFLEPSQFPEDFQSDLVRYDGDPQIGYKCYGVYLCLQLAKVRASQAYRNADSLAVLFAMIWLTQRYPELDFSSGTAQRRTPPDIKAAYLNGNPINPDPKYIAMLDDLIWLRAPAGPCEVQIDMMQNEEDPRGTRDGDQVFVRRSLRSE